MAGAGRGDVGLLVRDDGLFPKPDTQGAVGCEQAQDRNDEVEQAGRSHPSHRHACRERSGGGADPVNQHKAARRGNQLTLVDPVVHLGQTDRIKR